MFSLNLILNYIGQYENFVLKYVYFMLNHCTVYSYLEVK